MPSITDKLASALTQHNITVIRIPDGTYSLTHRLTPEQFHDIILPIFTELDLKPQDESWMPGTPTGDKDDIGYYVFSEETEDDWSVDLMITNDTIYWC